MSIKVLLLCPQVRRRTKYCDRYACLSVCLSAHVTRKPRPNFTRF